MKDVTNTDFSRTGWLLFTGVLAIVVGCSQQIEPNLHEEEVLKTLEEMRLAHEVGSSEVQIVGLGKKFLLNVRLAEHDTLVDPDFIASAKMTMNYYVECLEAKRQQDLLESYLENPPDTSVRETAPTYHTRHILLKSEDAARAIIQKLDQGADFATLAREFSTGPSSNTGGDLGWFSPSQMVKPFTEATAQLEKGSYSKEPVETQFGWHVILLEGIRPSETRTEDVRRSESIKARIGRSRKDLEELPGMIKELCGKGDAALDKTHGLRGG